MPEHLKLATEAAHAQAGRLVATTRHGLGSGWYQTNQWRCKAPSKTIFFIVHLFGFEIVFILQEHQSISKADNLKKGSSKTAKSWHILQLATSSTNKLSKHVNSDNFVGEDLKFSDDSLENRMACALQIGVYRSTGSGNNCHITNLSSAVPLEFVVNGVPCKIEEWEPERFAAIRSCFGVDPIEYR